MSHPSLAHREHRPWPLPARPWVIAQSWRHLLFAHWRVPAAALRPLVPEALALEEAEGSAWLGVVPFHLRIRPRGLPALPRIAILPEINVRTYVRHGGRPGVWFLSLDARSPLAVWAARRLFHLPYHRARMTIDVGPDRVAYRSERADGGPAVFRGRYGPSGPAARAAPGTLEHFLTERYCLYARKADGRLLRCEVHHAPWPLRPAWAEIEENTMAAPAGIDLSAPPDRLHFASRVEVTTWLPTAVPEADGAPDARAAGPSAPPALSPEEAGGMTVNERLFAAGLLDDFDRAVAAGDREAIRTILGRVHLSDENVEAVLARVLDA